MTTTGAGVVPLRVAVLGCGSIGRRHISNLLHRTDVRVVACEPDAGARRAAAELGVPVVATVAEALAAGPHVAFITAPTAAHLDLARAAADANCHLFIEKPLSHALAGIDDLCAEVSRRRLVTMVGCNLRFHFGPRTLKQQLNEGAIGELLAVRLHAGSYLPRWRPEQDYRRSYSADPASGGVLLDCIHEIDLALWYAGPARLLATAWRPATSLGLQTDGLAEVLLRHERGPLASVHLNFVQRDYRRTCQLIGDEGTLAWDLTGGVVTLYGPDGDPRQIWNDPDPTDRNRMYCNELEHFLHAVRMGGDTGNSLSVARAPLELALAAREAGRSEAR